MADVGTWSCRASADDCTGTLPDVSYRRTEGFTSTSAARTNATRWPYWIS